VFVGASDRHSNGICAMFNAKKPASSRLRSVDVMFTRKIDSLFFFFALFSPAAMSASLSVALHTTLDSRVLCRAVPHSKSSPMFDSFLCLPCLAISYPLVFFIAQRSSPLQPLMPGRAMRKVKEGMSLRSPLVWQVIVAVVMAGYGCMRERLFVYVCACVHFSVALAVCLAISTYFSISICTYLSCSEDMVYEHRWEHLKSSARAPPCLQEL